MDAKLNSAVKSNVSSDRMEGKHLHTVKKGRVTKTHHETQLNVRANIIYWNHKLMWVICPFCGDTHHHNFNGSYSISHMCEATCNIFSSEVRTPRQYQCLFPFDDRSAAYEIDKDGIFIAAGKDTSVAVGLQDSTRRLELVDKAESRRKWTELTETFPDSSQLVARWLLVDIVPKGDYKLIKGYLDTSAEKDILLHGVEALPKGTPGSDDPDPNVQTEAYLSYHPSNNSQPSVMGHSILHLAVREESMQMVELLLQKGANPNAADAGGITPLMTAALWGRIEHVKLLLHYSADKDLEGYRGCRKHKAADFAKPLPVNAFERSRGGETELNQFERDRDRVEIVRLLEDINEAPRRRQRRLNNFVFRSSPADASLITLFADFSIPQKVKTIGVMWRGSEFPCIAAMSGWAHSDNQEMNIHVAGKLWTEEVCRLSASAGHDLESHPFDHGTPGKFFACHAEKQLIAFFIHKHIFLPEDSDLEIANVQPPISLQKATIMVCRPVCKDCAQFIAKINDYFKIKIDVVHQCLEMKCKQCEKLRPSS